MFWLPDVAVSQVSSPPRKPPSGCQEQPSCFRSEPGKRLQRHVGCECNFLEPYFSLLSFPSFVSFRSSDHRKQSFHQNPPRAALPARSRAYSERLHSEPFGRQRPGANRRSIKQFFTRSKQTAASNKSCSLVAQLAASDEFRPPCCSLDGG
jgi:hypothetical protein